jgi:hypothetical protein
MAKEKKREVNHRFHRLHRLKMGDRSRGPPSRLFSTKGSEGACIGIAIGVGNVVHSAASNGPVHGGLFYMATQPSAHTGRII